MSIMCEIGPSCFNQTLHRGGCRDGAYFVMRALTYFLTYLISYLLSYLFNFLLSYLLSYLLTNLLIDFLA